MSDPKPLEPASPTPATDRRCGKCRDLVPKGEGETCGLCGYVRCATCYRLARGRCCLD